jgi:hypothetical protein
LVDDFGKGPSHRLFVNGIGSEPLCNRWPGNFRHFEAWAPCGWKHPRQCFVQVSSRRKVVSSLSGVEHAGADMRLTIRTSREAVQNRRAVPVPERSSSVGPPGASPMAGRSWALSPSSSHVLLWRGFNAALFQHGVQPSILVTYYIKL